MQLEKAALDGLIIVIWKRLLYSWGYDIDAPALENARGDIRSWKIEPYTWHPVRWKDFDTDSYCK